LGFNGGGKPDYAVTEIFPEASRLGYLVDLEDEKSVIRETKRAKQCI